MCENDYFFGYLRWSRVDESTTASLSRATSLSDSLLSESLHETDIKSTIVEASAGITYHERRYM